MFKQSNRTDVKLASSSNLWMPVYQKSIYSNNQRENEAQMSSDLMTKTRSIHIDRPLYTGDQNTKNDNLMDWLVSTFEKNGLKNGHPQHSESDEQNDKNNVELKQTEDDRDAHMKLYQMGHYFPKVCPSKDSPNQLGPNSCQMKSTTLKCNNINYLFRQITKKLDKLHKLDKQINIKFKYATQLALELKQLTQSKPNNHSSLTIGPIYNSARSKPTDNVLSNKHEFFSLSEQSHPRTISRSCNSALTVKNQISNSCIGESSFGETQYKLNRRKFTESPWGKVLMNNLEVEPACSSHNGDGDNDDEESKFHCKSSLLSNENRLNLSQQAQYKYFGSVTDFTDCKSDLTNKRSPTLCKNKLQRERSFSQNTLYTQTNSLLNQQTNAVKYRTSAWDLFSKLANLTTASNRGLHDLFKQTNKNKLTVIDHDHGPNPPAPINDLSHRRVSTSMAQFKNLSCYKSLSLLTDEPMPTVSSTVALPNDNFKQKLDMSNYNLDII